MDNFSHPAVCVDRDVPASWYYAAAMFVDYFYMVHRYSCLYYMPAVHLIVQMIQTACQFSIKNSCDFYHLGKYMFMCLFCIIQPCMVCTGVFQKYIPLFETMGSMGAGQPQQCLACLDRTFCCFF